MKNTLKRGLAYTRILRDAPPAKFTFWLVFLLLTACNISPAATPTNPIPQTPLPTATVSPSPSTPPTPVQVATPLPTSSDPITPEASPISLFLPPYLPDEFVASLALPQHIFLTDLLTATLRLETGAPPASLWIYALAVPFPTITDGVTLTDLLSSWAGAPSGPFAGEPLLMDEHTLGMFSAWWGAPASGMVETIPAELLLDEAWQRPAAWALMPFEALHPRWKVLEIDGQSPVRRDFDPASYPLSIPLRISVSAPLAQAITLQDLGLPATNRDASRLTVLNMTGVTAMVRGTALWMEYYGVTYPAQDIGSLLSSADLTHISNEIPFSPDCPFPELYPTQLVFCSSPRYMELLEAVGADLIELTGDHFDDYGPEATLYTLSLYQQAGLPYYGGGANTTEARAPLLIEHNGNHFAFLGCNIGCQVKNEVPCTALATETTPGAALCDFAWLESETSRLSSAGYLVIITFQHKEYYTYTVQPDLVHDFGMAAAAGATIVSGSQAHQPHGFSIDNDHFIHYGLGNLFFDQYHYCAGYACDDAFIDRHIFYNGRHIATELLTIRFIDLARPRPMTAEERADFLEIIFDASGW